MNGPMDAPVKEQVKKDIGQMGPSAMHAKIALLIITICAALMLAGTAKAQEIKPLNIEPDANGVDMLGGKVTPQNPELSVPASSNLKLGRLMDLQPLLKGTVQATNGASYATASFSINNSSLIADSLNCFEAECKSEETKGNGSSMIASYGINTYNYMQGGTGLRITFDSVYAQYTPPGILSPTHVSAYPSQMRYPSGETLDFTYDKIGFSCVVGTCYLHRPTKIKSNLGYEIQVTYHATANDIGNVHWGSVNQATLYKSTHLSTPLARHTYTTSGTMTDLAGRTWTGVSNQLGSPSQSNAVTLKLPGETVNSFTASGTTMANGMNTPIKVTTQINNDGAVYNYSYQLETAYGTGQFYVSNNMYYPLNTMLKKVTVTGPNGYSREVNIYNPLPASPNPTPTITSIKNGLNQTTNYEHDGQARLTKITMPEGNSVSITYDVNGNITEKRTKNKSGGGDLVETANYSSSGYHCILDINCFKPNWTRDALNKQTDYTWDITHGGMLTKLEPTGSSGHRRKTIYEYETKNTGNGNIYRLKKERVCHTNSSGGNISCGTATEQVTEYTYWGNTFLPLTVKRTNGTGSISAITTNAYDNAGNLLSSDGPLSGTADATYYRYDNINRRTWEISAQGGAGAIRKAVKTTYRPADSKPTVVEVGELSSPTDPTLTLRQKTENTYNSRRLLTKTDVKATGSTKYAVTQMSYNARNQLECSAVRMNPSQFGSLPSSACTLDTAGTMGEDRITKNSYDVLGRLTKTVGGYGVMDGAGAGQGNVEIELGYSTNGQVAWRKDGNGNKTLYTYDSHDRNNYIYYPHKTNVGTHSTTDYDRFTYNARGQILWHYRRDGRRMYHDYNANGSIYRKRYYDGGWLTGEYIYYTYDGLGRPTKERRAGWNGQGLTHTYDALGRLASTNDTTGGGSRTLSYLYDIAGRRTRVTHPDGVYFNYSYRPNGSVYQVKQYTTPVATYAHDGLGRATSVSYANGTSETFTYDPLSRLATQTNNLASSANDATRSFSYNPASQIISRSLTNNAYVWDGDANVNRNYAANGLNQYTSAGPASFTYDGNGNLTGDGSSTYTYDIENRLISAGGATPATLTYDPKGRLNKVTGSTTTRFLYDGDQLALEYASNGSTILRRYVHGAGVDSPIIWYEGSAVSSSTRRFLHKDARGSVVAVSNASGNPIQINTYDDWGIPAATNLGRFQYTGQIHIPELDVYYYKARLYSPTLGRFMQTDPIGYEDGMNMYDYVGGDPVSFKDPSGEKRIVFQDGNDVSITVYIRYHGPGASPSVIKKFNRGIRENWEGERGKYNVKIHIKTPNEKTPEWLVNEVYVPEGDGRANAKVWPSERPPWTAGHEAGHLFGLSDEYHDGKDGIMGQRDSEANERNVDNILNRALYKVGDYTFVRQKDGSYKYTGRRPGSRVLQRGTCRKKDGNMKCD